MRLPLLDDVFFAYSVSALFAGVDILVEPLRATLQTKVKANSVKQEFEKQDELKRSALRAVAALLSIPDSGKCLSLIEIKSFRFARQPLHDLHSPCVRYP